jgi:hypothetical protein
MLKYLTYKKIIKDAYEKERDTGPIIVKIKVVL